MGIKNLWSALRSYTSTDSNISQFAGQRVAVDMYVFLHRSVIGCVDVNMEALEHYLQRKYPHLQQQQQQQQPGTTTATAAAAEGEGEVTLQLEELLVLRDNFIDYMVHCIEALQRYGVIPVCVFDGAEMPVKERTDADRSQRRHVNFSSALQLLEEMYLKQGGVRRSSPDFQRALDHLSKAVDISTEMAHVIIQVLREERHIECLVSPYEADAEIAYLCREGYVQAGISEDSDLIAYFCPCVISKFNPNKGNCHVIRPPQCAPAFYEAMAAAAAAGGGNNNNNNINYYSSFNHFGLSASSNSSTSTGPFTAGELPLQPQQEQQQGGFAYHRFLLGCIMSGCDYAPNLSGVGVKKAFKIAASTRSMPEILEQLHRQHGFTPERLQEYRRQVLAAFYCFAHHVVYCPRTKTLQYFYPPPMSAGAPLHREDLIGKLWPAETARSVCGECLFDPQSLTFYRGTYKDCLQRYLRRTRQGQTSLRAFNGFQSFQASKVVVRLSESGGGHPGRASQQQQQQQQVAAAAAAAPFSQPLQKIEVAQGFHGTTARGATVGPAATIVRSKHFLRGLVVVDDHLWSDSDTEVEVVLEEASPSSAPITDVPTAAALLLPAGKICSCPYGYWQCNVRHSVFHKCFLGKDWVRGELPPSLLPSPPPSPDEESTAQTTTTTTTTPTAPPPPPPPQRAWRNFRPPRSTETTDAPPPNAPSLKRSRPQEEEVVVVTDDSRDGSCAEAPPPVPPPTLSVRSSDEDNQQSTPQAPCAPTPPPPQRGVQEIAVDNETENRRPAGEEPAAPLLARQRVPNGALRAAGASLLDHFVYQRPRRTSN